MLTKRGDIYYVDVRLPGMGRKRVTTGCRDRTRAASKIPEIMAGLIEEKDRGGSFGLTLAQGFQKLKMDERRQEMSDYKSWKSRTNEIMEFFGRDTPIEDVDEDSLVRLQHYLMTRPGLRGKPAAPATVNRKMAEIIHLLNTAHRYWRIIDYVPLIKQLKVDDKRRRAVTDKEFETLMGITRPKFRFLWRTLAQTGLRTAEWEALRWTDIDFDEKQINLSTSYMKIKTNSDRVVPLMDETLDELRERKDSGMSKPFSGFSRQTAKDEWNRCKKEMGLQHDHQFVPYSLRHRCATRMIERGVPTATVKAWMGHKNIQTTEGYLSQSTTSLRAALKAVSD